MSLLFKALVYFGEHCLVATCHTLGSESDEYRSVKTTDEMEGESERDQRNHDHTSPTRLGQIGCYV